jgi:hypothetical protein
MLVEAWIMHIDEPRQRVKLATTDPSEWEPEESQHITADEGTVATQEELLQGFAEQDEEWEGSDDDEDVQVEDYVLFDDTKTTNRGKSRVQPKSPSSSKAATVTALRNKLAKIKAKTSQKTELAEKKTELAEKETKLEQRSIKAAKAYSLIPPGDVRTALESLSSNKGENDDPDLNPELYELDFFSSPEPDAIAKKRVASEVEEETEAQVAGSWDEDDEASFFEADEERAEDR